MGTESISMKAKCRKMWDISKHMLKELGRFSEKTIAGKIVKIERTSAESVFYSISLTFVYHFPGDEID